MEQGWTQSLERATDELMGALTRSENAIYERIEQLMESARRSYVAALGTS